MDLSVKLKGQCQPLVLQNPILAASGTFGSGLEFQPFGDIGSLGGICVKGLSLEARAGAPSPRIVETASGMLNAVGLQNDGIEDFLENQLPLLPYARTAIIANIYGQTIDEFAQLASRLNDIEGISALEVNISCPNVAAGGAAFGSNPRSCWAVANAVRKNAPCKHIIVKLSPNVGDIGEIARSAEDAGADSISCINTLLGLAIDCKTRRPCLGNVTGGLSGPAIKPIALRCVWQVHQAVKIAVIGLGGICCVEDILEFMLAGASAVQIGTANFMRPDATFQLLHDLPDALARMGVSSPADLCGQLVVDSR